MPRYERHDLAPSVHLKAQDGKVHHVTNTKTNRNMILFFTGRVDDPETGREVEMFQRTGEVFDRLNADLVAVSADSVRGNRRMSREYGIDFDILADPRHKLSREFGVVDESTGRVRPTAVLVDSDGRIARILRGGRPEGYAARVALALSELERLRCWDALHPVPSAMPGGP